MIEEFELQAKKDKKKKERTRALKKVNKRWMERLDNMKSVKRDIVLKKREDIINIMSKKNDGSLKLLEKNKGQKESFNKLKEMKILEAERKVQIKIQRNQRKNEEKRLEEAKRSEHRLENFSKNNTLYLNKVKETFHNKLSNSMNTFFSNLKLVELDNDNKVKKGAEDSVKKFEKFYYHLKGVREELKHKKEKHHEKMVNKKEIMDDLQKKNDVRSVKIMEKLTDLTKKEERCLWTSNMII